MHFTIHGRIEATETIAKGRGIRELERLKETYGAGNWRKCKGITTVRLHGGWVGRAEVHWYEAHGIGKREFKLKQLLDYIQ